MLDIQKWLCVRLQKLRSLNRPPFETCLALQDRLEELGKCHGFTVTLHLWLSSRFEEAELDVMWANGSVERISACVVPMKWGTGRAH